MIKIAFTRYNTRAFFLVYIQFELKYMNSVSACLVISNFILHEEQTSPVNNQLMLFGYVVEPQ